MNALKIGDETVLQPQNHDHDRWPMIVACLKQIMGCVTQEVEGGGSECIPKGYNIKTSNQRTFCFARAKCS